MNKENLKSFIAQNGGDISLLESLREIYQDLALEWYDTDKHIAKSFEESSEAIQSLKSKLEVTEKFCDQKYNRPVPSSASALEFEELKAFFGKMNLKNLYRYSIDHRDEFEKKSQRLKELDEEMSLRKMNSKK